MKSPPKLSLHGEAYYELISLHVVCFEVRFRYKPWIFNILRIKPTKYLKVCM